MNDRTKSLLFDFIQISSIIFILFSGPVIASRTILIFFQMLAILILLISVWEMRRTRFYRIPDVGKQQELVKSGIFKFIRNPMYLSQIMFCGVLLIESYSVLRLLIYLIFVTSFVFKIQYEEVLLKSYF
ncbi:hypothetical protein A3B57_02930, partial [Microgenomates group bacterium RIFCSPLOWO2_01_FULL_47_10]